MIYYWFFILIYWVLIKEDIGGMYVYVILRFESNYVDKISFVDFLIDYKLFKYKILW